MRFLVLFLCIILTGCGQKGPLYPPGSPAPLTEISA
ncbi:MAG: LPS translocon maturation chaperone LptM [Pseudomonadales bacterium]